MDYSGDIQRRRKMNSSPPHPLIPSPPHLRVELWVSAALLAGLPIVERHAHVFAPHYVQPGRDAAVAQKNIDLRFRNPYPWPIRIRASARDDRLDIRLYGAEKPQENIQISADLLSTLT